MERKVVVVHTYNNEIATAFATQEIATGRNQGSRILWLGWNKPPPGRPKLNTDGCLCRKQEERI